MASTQSVCTRVTKLTLPVFILACLINIPKFFETELQWVRRKISLNFESFFTGLLVNAEILLLLNTDLWQSK